MRYFVFILSIISLLWASPTLAQDVNAGFVQGLWYSKEPVFEGVPTRIYVALRNNTEHDLTGTVRFSVDGKRIGSSDVRALSGRLVEAWVDWSPTKGEHTVLAHVSNAELHIIGQGTQQIDVAEMNAEELLFVDIDTDDDGVGNEDDTDDDGDGMSDEEEKANGTDPLVPDAHTESNQDDEDAKSDDTIETISQSEIPYFEDPENGLERFLSEGTADDMFSAVTERIENTKQSLDSYRENRAQEIEAKHTANDGWEPTVTDSTDTATITRTQLEPRVGLFERLITLLVNLFSGIWSLILLTVSFLLGFPALIELVLLWLILIVIYRTARRFGRRNN